jgi:hypothetical protein
LGRRVSRMKMRVPIPTLNIDLDIYFRDRYL